MDDGPPTVMTAIKTNYRVSKCFMRAMQLQLSHQAPRERLQSGGDNMQAVYPVKNQI